MFKRNNKPQAVVPVVYLPDLVRALTIVAIRHQEQSMPLDQALLQIAKELEN